MVFYMLLAFVRFVLGLLQGLFLCIFDRPISRCTWHYGKYRPFLAWFLSWETLMFFDARISCWTNIRWLATLTGVWSCLYLSVRVGVSSRIVVGVETIGFGVDIRETCWSGVGIRVETPGDGFEVGVEIVSFFFIHISLETYRFDNWTHHMGMRAIIT